MTLRLSILRPVAVIVAALAAGWWLRGVTAPEPPAAAITAAPAATIAATPPAAAPQPLIAVSSDGQVTLRVEQQPLDWVLDEIARQSGRSHLRADLATAAAPGSGPVAEACPQPVEPTRPADGARLLQAIERGAEADRFDGLLKARDEAFTLSPSMLQRIAETDASDRVRLLAFEALLEQQAGQPEVVRRTLETAQLMPGEAVPREARRRLDELRASERPDPADPQAQETP